MRRFVSIAVAAAALAGCGAGGKAGPPGTQGVVTVLTQTTSFSAATSGYYCQTPTYVAGANEGAIIMADLTCNSVPAGGSMAASAGYNDGVGDYDPGWYNIQVNNGATAAYMASSSTIFTMLTAGSTYFFEVYAIAPGTGTCYCQVTAEVIRL